jgi:uncharacterized membrane protein YgdD (TMEM256/DUF423 family)
MHELDESPSGSLLPKNKVSGRRVIVAFLGASGVLAAAFGAHGLERIAGPEGVRWWAIAAVMQLMTAPALLYVGDNRSTSPWVFRLLSAGTLVFCGTLYLMTLGAPRFLGALTPLGGLLMTAGWATVAVRHRTGI